MKRGECPNCGTKIKMPALGVTLLEFDDKGKTRKELWCSGCRDALAPEETSLMARAAFGDPRDKKTAMKALRSR